MKTVHADYVYYQQLPKKAAVISSSAFEVVSKSSHHVSAKVLSFILRLYRKTLYPPVVSSVDLSVGTGRGW